jgi:hypothetical protein
VLLVEPNVQLIIPPILLPFFALHSSSSLHVPSEFTSTHRRKPHAWHFFLRLELEQVHWLQAQSVGASGGGGAAATSLLVGC